MPPDTLTRKGEVYSDILVEVFRLRGALLESSERIAAAAGLTTARWQVLGAVADEARTVSDIARRLGLTRQAVQETADGMARDGLAEYADNPRHRRARLVSPSAAARRSLDTLRPRREAFANLMGAQHSLDALRATLAVLRASRVTIESRMES